MINDLFYSERETGLLPRTQERISLSFWIGFIALIDNMIAKDFFVETFPARNVELSMFGEIPDLGWPPLHDDSLPDSLTVLDAVEFFARHVSKPTSQYDRFDRERGFLEYADHVNKLFRRNQHPFFLDEYGIVKRQLPETLQPIVVQDLRSPDQEVNRLLDAAILKLQDKESRSTERGPRKTVGRVGTAQNRTCP